MSPLWRDEIGLLIAPRRVLFNRMRRGLRPQCTADACITVEDGSFTDWTPTLAALRTQLLESSWRDANVRAVIADHWVRYAAVPWSREVRGESERLVHARHVLAHVYGDVFEDWTIVLSESVPGSAQIASAMPTALLDQLRGVVEASRSRLLSVEPQLVVAFNIWRSRLPQSGWFVSIDDGSLAAARLTPSGWDQVRSVRIGSNWSAELHRLRVFGRLASAGSGEQRVFVEAPLWLRKIAGDGDVGLEWLEEMDSPSATLGKLVELKRLYA